MSTRALGRPLRAMDADGIVLAEAAYAAHSVLPRHAHDAAFFSLALAGGYLERRVGTTAELGAGAIAFEPVSEEHAIRVGGMDARCLNIELTPRWLERMQVDGRREAYVRAVGGPLVWMGRRVYDEMGSWSSASPLAVQTLVADMLGFVQRDRGSAVDRRPPRWLDAVDEILRSTYREAITVDGLAREVGVHPIHLSRTWRRFRRTSIGDAVRWLRIDEARRRLSHGHERIAHIAADLGFSDHGHLTRLFKDWVHVTPTAYRRRARG